MKNQRGAEKRGCQQKKHRMIPRELVLGPHSVSRAQAMYSAAADVLAGLARVPGGV